MHFQDPWILILLPAAALLVFLGRRIEAVPSFQFSTDKFADNLPVTFRIRLHRGLVLFRLTALLLIITALARPQSMLQESSIETEGVDIVLSVDVSTTMLAEDFDAGVGRKSRVDAVKDVVREFINNRRDDRIGITAFAARAYTVSPLTLDYGWLLQNVERVKVGLIEDGTAIGSGISAALNRLKDSQAKSKVVILLTDGRNNAGTISPLTAAEAAAALNIKVYTIGAGTKGLAPFPAKDMFGNKVYRQVKVDIDEELLRQIAAKTHAKYFRATDTKSLRDIYMEINRLEKSHIEEKGYVEYKELFHLFLIPGLALLLLEIVLNNTVLRRIP
ncbi:MAG: VWA domain-containing protein [Planctomycetes bacterium]|nr:VWA domain-containing protein [Planctomycetota bacterium]MBI5741962.1 VWA domain-containing protein [Nitrospirota bacterium]